jgi:ATP adenylyltransferase
MDRLWAPWRVEYIRNPGTGCFFCQGLKASDDKSVLILERSSKAFIIMNRYPYNNGHCMIAPLRHIGLIEKLDDEEIRDMHRLLARAVQGIGQAMKPHGFNIGVNQGKVAGAGVVDHIHIHLVPRWTGDTNFMPVIGETKVVSEALLETYENILRGLRQIDEP